MDDYSKKQIVNSKEQIEEFVQHYREICKLNKKINDLRVGDVFVDVSSRGFFRTVYSYIIDSKFRTQKKLSKFIEEQLYNLV